MAMRLQDVTMLQAREKQSESTEITIQKPRYTARVCPLGQWVVTFPYRLSIYAIFIQQTNESRTGATSTMSITDHNDSPRNFR